MNLPPVILLGMFAFAAGWGADAWLGHTKDAPMQGGTRIPAVARPSIAALRMALHKEDQ